MRIGLVRHFKVNLDNLPGYIEAREFSNWMRDYDNIEVIPRDVDLRNIPWNRCYASDLYRAKTTANIIYDGEIVETPLLREISMKFTGEFEARVKRKVSFLEWSVYSMVNWAKGADCVEETIADSRKRINKFLDGLLEELKQEDNVLLVCHGMIMTVLDEELKKRGFLGETVVAAKNGELFLYEK